MALNSNNPNPATRSVGVVPSDTAPLDDPARALYIGTGGTLVATLTDDSVPRTFKNVPAGVLPLSVKQVMATGTFNANTGHTAPLPAEWQGPYYASRA